MQPYLDACQHNEKKALALYQWHGELTASVQAVLGVTEVILRNAMDRELQDWNKRRTGKEDSWLLCEPASPLRSLSAGKRKNALENAEKECRKREPDHHRYGLPVSHDDVLAQVTFGMWKDLLPNHVPGANQDTVNANRFLLWDEALHRAFPNVEDPSGEVTFWRVYRLHSLRNRVSHMEPLLHIDVRDRMGDAFGLVRSIDVDVAQWLSGISRVSAVLNLCPRGLKPLPVAASARKEGA